MKHFYLFFLWLSIAGFAQQKEETTTVDVNFMAGNILAHRPDIRTLITGHPEAVMVSFSKKTYGSQEWERAYNYPDFGYYFLYQDFKNQYLGHNFAVGAQYNFYFLKRHLSLKVAEGFAMTTNPHNNETNNKNIAFGSKFMLNTVFGLQYKKENIIDKFGLQAGLFFTHFSNGKIKAPNSGINTYNISLGINYNFEKPLAYIKDTTTLKSSFKEPIKYNFVFRTGVNESPVINSGQYPFYHIGFYADKRLNRKSGIQLGTELFLTQSFKDFIKYYSNAYPQKNVSQDTDYKRVGVFIGHELYINKLSIETQLGYYVYQPFKYDIVVYDRLGAKYYFTKNLNIGGSIVTHGFLAEAVEFSAGIRF
jgi:hypothetical protein